MISAVDLPAETGRDLLRLRERPGLQGLEASDLPGELPELVELLLLLGDQLGHGLLVLADPGGPVADHLVVAGPDCARIRLQRPAGGVDPAGQ